MEVGEAPRVCLKTLNNLTGPLSFKSRHTFRLVTSRSLQHELELIVKLACNYPLAFKPQQDNVHSSSVPETRNDISCLHKLATNVKF